MATKAPAAPRSGFTTWQFWLGLISVLLTFVLGYFGVQLPSNLLNSLPEPIRNGIVPGVIGVGLVIVYIAISSYIETRSVKNGKKPNTPTVGKTSKPFWQTSEFWLGAVTVILNYLEDAKALPFPTDVRASTSTTTLLLALAYMFARAQLKQAYANAEESKQ